MEPRIMTAAILTQLNHPLEIAEVEIPALEFGQVLVKVEYSGICGTQINEIAGVKGEDKWLPHLLGHEGSGIVQEVGEGVSTVAVGDHVVLHWRQGAGIQARPPKYSRNGAVVNAGWVTTFNEYAVVSENRVTTIPKSFDMRSAPLFGCAITTAFGSINNDATLKIGEAVVIFGVGGVGLSIVQGADMVAAQPIIAIDLFENKLEMAKMFGATHTINANQIEDIKKAVLDIVGTQGADTIFETTGNPRIIEVAYELTSPNGKTVLLGVPMIGENVSLYTLPLHFNKTLTGSHGGSAQPDRDIPRYVRLVEAGKLNLEDLITHEFKLEEINEAIDLIRSGQTGRVIIDMSERLNIDFP